MGNQVSEAAGVGVEPSRPLDAWPDDVDSEWPPDPATRDDLARFWAECNSDLARHLASMPEPPDSDGPPPVTSTEFAEEAFSGGPDGAAAVLANIDPGSSSAALLAMLDPARVTPAAMVGVIAATEKLASWVQALQHRWLAAFTVPGVAASREGLLAYASAPGQKLHRMARAADQGGIDSRAGSSTGLGVCSGEDDLPWSGPTVHGDPELNAAIDEVAFKVAAAEISAALHFSPMTAQRRVRQALDFTIDLPGTLQALSRGQIDRGRALTILDRTENLPVDLRHRVEAAVLPKASARTPGQLRGIVDRAVISVDPAAAKKRQIKAREERHVTVRPERDGMSTFVAELPAEQAGIAFSVLDRVATTLHRNRDEVRRIGALRADVFSDIFDQLATQGLVDLRATLGGRAVITDDPSRFSWISDTATIAARFDPDTSLIDPHYGRAEHADTVRDTGPTESASTDLDSSDDEWLAGAGPANDDGRHTPSDFADPADSARKQDPADHKPASDGDVPRSTTGFAPDAHPQANDVVVRPVPTASDETSPDKERRRDAGAVAAGDPPARIRNHERPTDSQTAPGPDSYHSFAFGGPPPNDYSSSRAPFVFATQQGRHTHLNVTIAATTLAGLDDLPGELDGHGRISADVCRALAVSAASITAVAVDRSCGTALDVGRTVYRPRLSHRDHVVQRDRTCRFPGCRQPARRCQIDHSEEFCSGGATCPCNLSCLCKFHHDLKTTGLWDAQQNPDASIVWTSPTGRTYRTQTPEWPIAAPNHQAEPSTSTVNDAETCNTGDARMPAGPKPTTADKPPF